MLVICHASEALILRYAAALALAVSDRVELIVIVTISMYR